MKKIFSVLMAAALLTALLCLPVFAETNEQPDIWAAIAGENGTTYVNLFDVILREDCYQIWFDDCAAVMGEENAADIVAMLQGSISSELYGEAATAVFGTSPQSASFNCFYINGLKSVSFAGNTATMILEDGSSETHTYEYIGQYMVGEGERMVYYGQEFDVAFPCDVYQSTDEAGEFNYFFLRDDTMEETYHIEFRYGSDLEDLQGYFVGPYAYWLTAGFDADADEQTLKNVIDLFCLENLDYSSHTDAALAQLAEIGITGSWKADLSAFGDEYAAVDLSMTINENGHGITTMNGIQTADFEAYAYDNGEKGDNAGLYVAYSNLEYEAESAPYTLLRNENNEPVLTLTAEDGTISWMKQEAAASSDVIEISTAEELSAINENLSGNYILTADIDLAGIEWTPIGTYVPSGESEEEQEIPSPDYAFTGSFDGKGHKISNLVINQPEGWALGLFGTISNAVVGNFTLENASADGSVMTADVIGYAFSSAVYDINLINGKVTAHFGEMSEEGKRS